MTRSRIGYNVHGQNIPDVGRLKAHLLKVKPTVLVVMDNLGFAQEIKALLPDTMVIHRNYGITNGDDDVHIKVTPERWMELRAKESEVGIYLYTTNEPGFEARTIQWHVELMELAAKQGVKLVIGNWSVGKPGPDDWGQAKRMLELLDEHRDFFVLGLHEYACGIITSGLYGGYPNNANKQPGEPGGFDLVPFDKWPGSVFKITQWHCGRFNFLVNYCKNNNIQPPRIVLTEHGMDDVSDIKGWAEKLEKTANYSSIRGWKSLRTQWEKWFSGLGWSAERAYFEQLKYADKVIYQGSDVEGQAIYCWGHSSEVWDQFDVSEASELQKLLEDYAGADDTAAAPVEVSTSFARPTNATKKLTLRALNGMNVLCGPALACKKISAPKTAGEIQKDTIVRVWGVPSIPVSDWMWVYCQIVTGDYALAEGWLYLPDFEYREISTKEIPVVKPSPAPLQSHTFTVKLIAPAPNGDVMAAWLRKQLEGAGDLFKSLDSVDNVQFEVEENQS